jgi:phage baseplate assembly protein W
MMPTFGTQIPDLAFEPLDEVTLDILRSELEYVFKYDPRVDMQSLAIIPDYDNNRVLARATLRYVELNQTETVDFNIEFDSGGR